MSYVLTVSLERSGLARYFTHARPFSALYTYVSGECVILLIHCYAYMIYIFLKSAVRMLQAANGMWIHVRERDNVDSRRRYDWTEPGLYVVEQ